MAKSSFVELHLPRLQSYIPPSSQVFIINAGTCGLVSYCYPAHFRLSGDNEHKKRGNVCPMDCIWPF